LRNKGTVIPAGAAERSTAPVAPSSPLGTSIGRSWIGSRSSPARCPQRVWTGRVRRSCRHRDSARRVDPSRTARPSRHRRCPRSAQHQDRTGRPALPDGSSHGRSGGLHQVDAERNAATSTAAISSADSNIRSVEQRSDVDSVIAQVPLGGASELEEEESGTLPESTSSRASLTSSMLRSVHSSRDATPSSSSLASSALGDGSRGGVGISVGRRTSGLESWRRQTDCRARMPR
jgi:hypothetical protein